MDQVESSVNYENACRLCLSTSGEILPIFSSGSEDQTGSSLLVEKIQECVAVEITEFDGLPTQICTKCSSNVDNWHKFKRLCNYSQAKLRNWVNGETSEATKEDLNQEEQNGSNIVIDASYPNVDSLEKESKLQPEGPPILASLGLAPKNEKENGGEVDEEEEEEEEEEDEEEEEESDEQKQPEVHKSMKIVRPLRQLPTVKQMSSKTCLVCGRTYRYSHNARRHELVSHKYDRYSNKIMPPKFRPNPLNPKARLLQNPINQRVVTIAPKITPRVTKNEPYPVKIRSLVDMQNSNQPQILKSLLTRRPELVVTEPEIMRSGSASPETLISEPELAAYHVETIISEPDTYINSMDHSEEEDDEQNYPAEDDSEGESVLPTNAPSHRGLNGENKADKPMRPRIGAVEHITPDDHDSQSADEGVDPEDNTDGEQDNQDGDKKSGEGSIAAEELNDEDDNNDDGETHEETYNEIDVDEHDVQDNNDSNFDESMPPEPLAPIVEINEGQQGDADGENSKNMEDTTLEPEGEGEGDEEKQTLLGDDDAPMLTVTETPGLMTPQQKAFILKYRDVIEQVNTLKCKCCDRIHPRRKAVIQHLQKTGQKVPKHTCYNCVITFSHIGALLSHMRANVCTDLWKVIFEEGGIRDELVEEGSTPVNTVTKLTNDKPHFAAPQNKDILNARLYACMLCPTKYRLKQMIMKHITDVHENGGQRVPLSCMHCKYRFKDKPIWKKHIRNGECTVCIACEFCDETFRTLAQFGEHVVIHAGSTVNQSSESINKSLDGRPTDCHLCGKGHNNYHNLVKHLKIVHNEENPHMCQHCDSKFAQVTELNHHIYFAHSDRTVNGEVDLSIVKQEEVTTYNYSCTDCDAIFDSVDGWTQHQIDEHNHTAYECDLCDKKYLQESELVEHKNEHLKVRFYSCTLCSNSYNSAQTLSEHMIKSHPGHSSREFYCEMCRRSFKNRQAFSNHMRMHTNIPTQNKKSGDASTVVHRNSYKTMDTPYSCDICGKGFMHKKNIWKHKKVLHPEEARRIEMEKTGQYFLSSSLDMQSQSNNSTGLSIPQFDSFTTAVYEHPAPPEYKQASSVPVEKPVYTCDLCDKKFSNKSSMWKHKSVKHGIVNPSLGDQNEKVSCSVCKINFSDKKSYERHVKTVHNVSCKICGIGLNSTLELYEHYKAVHAKELLGYNASQGSGVEDSREGSEDGEYGEYDGEYGAENEENPEDKYQARYPCGDCGRTFVGMTALQEHDCNDPSQSLTYDCEICHKSYTSISALKSHRGWHLRSPDGKAAFSSSGLWMPQRQPSKVSKFEVRPLKHSTPMVDHLEIKRKLPPDVQMTVVKKQKLNDEVTMETVRSVPRLDFAETAKKLLAEENRTCSPCNKQFSSKAGYMRHMEEVHKPNSIFCPLCSKSFTRKSTLLVHMRKHGIMTDGAGSGESGGEGAPMLQKEVEKLYACDMCNVRYTTSKSLRRHRLKHHAQGNPPVSHESRPTPASIVGTRVVEVGGPSKHKCNTCNETFPSEKEMWQHSHYACEQCPMVFSRQQYLSAHVRSRHQEAQASQFFPCSMCDRFYMNKKSLQRHIEASH